jgi:hypothetical protein
VTYTEPTIKVAGNALLAADYNTEVRDNLKTLADPWPAYTPTLGTWTLGNGSLTGNYIKFGQLVFFRLRLDVGSTTTCSGNPVFGLPADAVSTFSLPIGQALLADASGTSPAFRATRTAVINSGTNLILRAEDGSVLSGTVPWTWDTDDVIEISGFYQADS